MGLTSKPRAKCPICRPDFLQSSILAFESEHGTMAILANMMMKLLFVVGLLSITASISSAGVIFSTDSTATPGFFPSNGTDNTSSVFHAFQFTVGAGNGGVLNQLVVAGQSGTDFTETFDILSDDVGSPGSVLDTVPETVTGDGVSRLYSASPATSLTLIAGTTYWIEAASPSGSDAFLWLEANPIVNTTEVSSARTGTFPDQPSAAFALLSAPAAPGVPEPGTWLLSLGCFLPLVVRQVRQSRRTGKRAGESYGASAPQRSV